MKNFITTMFVVVTLSVGVGLVNWLQKPVFNEVPQLTTYTTLDSSVSEKARRLIRLAPTFDPLAEQVSAIYPTELLDEEIKYLISRASEREEGQAVLFLELYNNAQIISTSEDTLVNLVEDNGRIHTKELIDLLWSDIETIVAREQLRFNVARPTQIDLRVNSLLKIPETPSYPDELTAKLTILRLLLDELGHSDQVLNEAINVAIDRTNVYGINTRFDTDYAKQLAAVYFQKVLATHPTFAEYIVITKDREWSGGLLPKRRDDFLPDVAIVSTDAEVVDGGIIFKVVLKNLGIASTPVMHQVQLDVDVFGDKITDHKVIVMARQLFAGQEDTISYFLPIIRSGEHLFRFTLDPEAELGESSYLNNLSAWQQLSS